MKRIVIIIAVMLMFLSGCKGGMSAPSVEVNSNNIPSITEYGDTTIGTGYYYVVDDRTGVVYLACIGVNRSSMTVMLNEDGTPVTAEQIGLK